MFTGIVEELGSVAARDGAKLRINASVVLDDVSLGASIAVNGCCLTVIDWGSEGDAGCDKPSWWVADVSDESFARTALGGLRVGDLVNLERPVRLTDRLGGHLVQGHVDSIGEIVRPAPDLEVRVRDRDILRYVVEKGSITV